MDLAADFLAYAAAFRLAVIAAGVVAIVLGYKLFVKGVMPEGRTSASAGLGDVQLSVRNAAPGTCFALFGAAIIVFMLAQGGPELSLDTPSGPRLAPDQASGLRLKGGEEQAAGPTLESATRLLGEGRMEEAMRAYSRTLAAPDLTASRAAAALEPMARIALSRGEDVRAETLARLAALFSGGDGAALDTLARALLSRGEAEQAVAHARRAAEAAPVEPRRLHTLALSLEALGRRDEAAEVLRRAAALDPIYEVELTRLEDGS